MSPCISRQLHQAAHSRCTYDGADRRNRAVVHDLRLRITDWCLQMHGSYGYLYEYQVSQECTDARAKTIYGGTNEIMKEIIGPSLQL